jgi:DNA-binding CsgD family transcriptional regulator
MDRITTPAHVDIESLSLDEARKLLRAMTIREVRYTSILRRTSELMKALQPSAPAATHATVQGLLDDVSSALDEHEQHRFEFVIETMQGAFLQHLAKDYPSLTPTELRLAAFLRLPMPSREVARLFSCSVRSVEKHRERMRKKFGLIPSENLTTFLTARV